MLSKPVFVKERQRRKAEVFEVRTRVVETCLGERRKTNAEKAEPESLLGMVMEESEA